MCEPIAFQGTSSARPNPIRPSCGSPIGEGLTGWVAATARRSGSASVADPRRLACARPRPESMLLVPMTFEARPRGDRALQAGRDRFDADDETTLTIFAGYAAQALVNGTSWTSCAASGRARAPARGSATPARGQRAAALDSRSGGRPRPDRGLAQDDRPVRLADHLPGDRVRRRPPGGRRPGPVRRGDPRLRGPLGAGITGWVIDHGEAVLANDAHLDPRSIQVPGDAVRARGDDRRPAASNGRPSGRSTSAGWAMRKRPSARTSSSSPTVRRPGLDRPPERRDPRGGPSAPTSTR